MNTAAIVVKSISWIGSSSRSLRAAEPNLIVNGVQLGQGICKVGYQNLDGQTMMRPERLLVIVVEYRDCLVPKDVKEMIQKNTLV
ncbi:hypothetical protein ACH5A9_02895 [Lactiplantibacillus plantarum]|uniref:hypothetical protein n=1 Tax=Lactiplantibacillus plantarum TaxID=1590 RepID=UPI000FF1D212|nr:hypothetical protein [Lactiplantibacillus plantarum]RWU87224.1 hypothetical protein EPT12_14765 [Lactiplantibacillus plantarum]RXS45585.1 hypothetical protein EST32_13525 [Lactiplantibacillus plantarum]